MHVANCLYNNILMKYIYINVLRGKIDIHIYLYLSVFYILYLCLCPIPQNDIMASPLVWSGLNSKVTSVVSVATLQVRGDTDDNYDSCRAAAGTHLWTWLLYLRISPNVMDTEILDSFLTGTDKTGNLLL